MALPAMPARQHAGVPMRIALLLCCLAVAGAADDAYAAWWRRADAALVAGDAARVRGDPPPAAAGGEGLAHHRVLLAWLGGDARVRDRLGGLLAAVRAASGAAVRLIDPGAPLSPVPGAGAALWADAVAGGPPDWQAHVRMCAADGDPMSAAGLWLERSRLWSADPVAAAARFGGERPQPLPEAELDAVLFACYAIQGGDGERWPSPAAQAFRYRVRADCAEAWWPVADELSWDGRPGASGADILRLAEAATGQSAAMRLVLPALAMWAHRCENEGAWLVRTGLPRRGFDLLRHCLDEPVRAGDEIRAVRRHLAALTAALPDEAAEEPAEDLGSPIQERIAAAAAAQALREAAAAVQAFAAGNAAVEGPMALWGAGQIAAAEERIAACEEALAGPMEALQQVVIGNDSAWQPTMDGIDWVLVCARAVVQAVREARPAALASARAELHEAYAGWHARLAVAAGVIAAANGGEQPMPPRHLGLGEAPCPAPAGWRDAAVADDEALLAACSGAEARLVAAHLVALRRAGAGRADLADAWRRLQRRRDAYARLAAAGRPDLDLIAADAQAPVGAALIAAVRGGGAIAPDAAVRSWMAAASRPLAGTLPPVAVDRAWIARETLLMRAAGLSAPWQTIARWIAEGGERAGDRLALAERLLQLRAAEGPLHAAAGIVGAWAAGNRRIVAAAFATAAAAGWPDADRFLALARAHVALVRGGLP